MLVGCTLAIVGYIMLLAGSHSGVKYGGTFFVACGGMQDPSSLTCPWGSLPELRHGYGLAREQSRYVLPR